MKINYLTTEEACEFLRCKPDTLKTLRNNWIPGVHYIRRGPGATAPFLYAHEMILDWMVNREAPETHQAAIENFRRSLPSGRKKKR